VKGKNKETVLLHCLTSTEYRNYSQHSYPGINEVRMQSLQLTRKSDSTRDICTRSYCLYLWG